MASGLPVIAYDTENTRGVIENGKTGILVSEGEKLEIAILKIDVIKKDDLIKFAKEFTWQKYAKKFIQHQSPIRKNSWI